jgi:hypothetical protein
MKDRITGIMSNAELQTLLRKAEFQSVRYTLKAYPLYTARDAHGYLKSWSLGTLIGLLDPLYRLGPVGGAAFQM